LQVRHNYAGSITVLPQLGNPEKSIMGKTTCEPGLATHPNLNIAHFLISAIFKNVKNNNKLAEKLLALSNIKLGTEIGRTVPRL
jgi:hypothetical protein